MHRDLSWVALHLVSATGTEKIAGKDILKRTRNKLLFFTFSWFCKVFNFVSLIMKSYHEFHLLTSQEELELAPSSFFMQNKVLPLKKSKEAMKQN